MANEKRKSTDNNSGIKDSLLPELPWTKISRARKIEVDNFMKQHPGCTRRQARKKSR